MTKTAIIGYAILVFCIAVLLILPLTHPELTQTQLLVEFWKEWLVLAVAMAYGGYFAKDGKR